MSEEQVFAWRSQDVCEELARANEMKTTVMERGPLKVVFIRPTIEKTETHQRDEVYVVTSGALSLIVEGKAHRLETGDAAFVPAGAEHTFHELTGDVHLWSVRSTPAG
jgi:mannose-6-phosphate isomerase-like protein (cupin superfamily)